MRNNDFLKIIAEQQCQRVNLRGLTLKYNNLVQNGNFEGTESGLSYSYQNGRITISGTSTAISGYINIYISTPIDFVNGHKYLLLPKKISSSGTINFNSILYYGGGNTMVADVDSPSFYTSTSSGTGYLYVRPNHTFNGSIEIKLLVIDLTELGLDGISSVDEFYRTALGYQIKNGLVLPFSATNKIMSVESAFTFKGRNLLLENILEQGTISGDNGLPTTSTSRVRANSYISVEPNTEYYLNTTCTKENITGVDFYIFLYDNSKNFIGRIPNDWQSAPYSFTTTGETKFIKFVFRTRPELTINENDFKYTLLQLNSFSDKKYVQYLKQLVFSTPMQLNGIDNDGYVDLGELTWYMASNGMFIAAISNKKSGVGYLLNNKYKYESGVGFSVQNGHIADSGASGYTDTIFIRDNNFNNATTFKNALKGTILRYETSKPSVVDTYRNDNGKLTKRIGKIKLSDANITYSGGVFTFKPSNIERWQITNQPSTNIKVADYQIVGGIDLRNYDSAIAQAGNNINIRDTQYTSVNELISAKGNIIIYYVLATPYEYMFDLNLGELEWEGNGNFTADLIPIYPVAKPRGNTISPKYNVTTLTPPPDKTLFIGGNIRIRDDDYVDDKESFVASLQGSYLSYELPLPTLAKSVLLDHRYETCTDKNGLVVEMEKVK